MQRKIDTGCQTACICLSTRASILFGDVILYVRVQAMLRSHRLGTIAAAAQDVTAAEQLLHQSQQHFSRRLGQDNPITGEVNSIHCLILKHLLWKFASSYCLFEDLSCVRYCLSILRWRVSMCKICMH